VYKPNPSLYIRHLTNMYLPGHPSGGAIGVLPQPGQHLNGASKCSASRTVKYGIGVHCDLYTDRF
jgi:hypothetical protein